MSRLGIGSCKQIDGGERGGGFTDYRPNCELNEWLKAKYAPGSSSEYRLFLQRNGCRIMDEMRQFSIDNSQNPTGCHCNFNHPPHDRTSTMKYNWRPSPGFLAQKLQDYHKPIPAAGMGNWTNYC